MWLRSRMIGKVRVTSLTDGMFSLDGGAMFGVVPKVLWERAAPADESNRVQMRMNPLLIQIEGRNVLVETGFWDQGGDRFEEMYALDRDETVFSGLRAMGLTPEDVHMVINTHLHFDHAGRNTTPQGKPTFERAAYVVQAQELHDATHPHDRNRASYLPPTFEPVLQAGLFEVVEGEAEVLPGLSVVPLPGHNLGQQGVVLRSEGEVLVHPADLMPTVAHAPYAWVMGYDLYPVTCMQVRQRYFPQWAAEGAVIAPPHDARVPFARLEEHPKGGFRAVELQDGRTEEVEG